MYIYLHIYIHTYTFIYIHIHTYTYTYIHIYIVRWYKTFIPRREFIFRTCEDGAAVHLIPRRINPCLESFLGHIGTGRLCGG